MAVPALLLTEQGTERRAGVWCVPTGDGADAPPLDRLGPEADRRRAPTSSPPASPSASMRLHGFLRDQRAIAGLGRRLANEVCHRAKLSPFAMTRKLGVDGCGDGRRRRSATRSTEGLAYERSARRHELVEGRPGRVHDRAGEACPVCGDTIRAVEYSGYTVNYCPTCQTGGKVLADNTTSKFLK